MTSASTACTVELLSTAATLERFTEVVASAACELVGSDGATFVLREDDKCFHLSDLAGEVAEYLLRASKRPVDVQIETGLVAELDPVLGRLMVQNLFDNAAEGQAGAGATFYLSLPVPVGT
jgi:hypothetical protein